MKEGPGQASLPTWAHHSCHCGQIVPTYERMIVFRLGRIRTPQGPGMVLLLPFIDSFQRVDLRTRAFNVPPCKVRGFSVPLDRGSGGLYRGYSGCQYHGLRVVLRGRGRGVERRPENQDQRLGGHPCSLYLAPRGHHFVHEALATRQVDQAGLSRWASPLYSPNALSVSSFMASPNSWPLRMELCCPWGPMFSSASGTQYCQ